MNNQEISNNIINLPSKKSNDVGCCIHCGKGYKSKTMLEKHLILCEITHKTKNKQIDVFENDVPSQKMMYKMILELGQKLNRMEEKMDKVNKWVVKKKKKINVLEWLNNTVKPEYTFERVIDNVIIANSDIEYLFNNNIYDTLNEVFSRTIYFDTIPIFASIQKSNLLYIFDTIDGQLIWTEMTRDKLIRFLNQVQMKLSKALFEWKKQHKAELNSSDTYATMFDKSVSKLMGADFKQDNTLSRIRNMIYNKMKIDVKTMVEYEFE